MAPRARNRTRASASPRIRPWTRTDLARLPDDGNRYEVLDGQLLVTPQASYAHQRMATAFVLLLEAYVRRFGVAHVVGPGAVPFGKNELQPDIQVIPGPFRDGKWKDAPTPILVVEVLSASTRRRDLGIKLDAYRDRIGIPTLWVVDRIAREVHVAEPGAPPRVEREALAWQALGATEPLHVNLPAFFKETLGG